MSKSNRKKTLTITLSAEDVDRINRRSDIMKLVDDVNYKIVKADIKDDLCSYKIEIISGIGTGKVLGVNDPHIIEPDMKKAFSKFNVHMAVICGAFKFSNIEIDDIDKFHEHDITGLFTVTGFEMHGTDDDPKIKLVGNVYIDVARGRIEQKTHKVPLDSAGGYQWYNELLKAADDAKLEVVLYNEGFYEPVKEEEEEAENKNQTALNFENNGEAVTENEFESGKV